MLAAGADVNAKDKNGETPLFGASTRRSVKTLRLMVEAGADVNAKDDLGAMSLHWTVQFGTAEGLRLLLAAGARVNERNADGETALDLAGDDECREVLRQAGGKTGAELDAEQAKPAQEPVKPPEPGQ